jgi:hypothetical protein
MRKSKSWNELKKDKKKIDAHNSLVKIYRADWPLSSSSIEKGMCSEAIFEDPRLPESGFPAVSGSSERADSVESFDWYPESCVHPEAVLSLCPCCASTALIMVVWT